MTNIPKIALSVRQPWAWAIIHAGKDIENRDWSRLAKVDRVRRGPIAIHASKGMTRMEYAAAALAMARLGILCPPAGALERGGIIGVATIVDVVREHWSPWFAGPVGLVLADPIACAFIPSRGQLGFFPWVQALDDVAGAN